MKGIGILTSGGDCPGMNACVAGATMRATRAGLELIGIRGGFEGILGCDSSPLDEAWVRAHSRRGGTALGTSRNGKVKSRMSADKLREAFQSLQIEALIVLGGGGSLDAASAVADAGLPVVGVPCTIDNDIAGTDYSVGFDSACNRVISAANDIADTAESLPGRVFLIETLGGDTGHIAVASSYAIGADGVIVPEISPVTDVICERIRAEMDAGKPHAIVVVAEGAGPAQDLVEPIARRTGRRVRATVMGHAQRGGDPTYCDRRMAREFGELSVELVLAGEQRVMTALATGAVIGVPLTGGRKPLDAVTYNAVNRLEVPK